MTKTQAFLAEICLAALTSIMFSGPVSAAEGPKNQTPNSLWMRCEVDTLAEAQATGRVAWAASCGDLGPDEAVLAQSFGLYPTFTFGIAPTVPFAPCSPDTVQLIGLCKVAGCYPPDQELLFSDSYLAVGDAYEAQKDTITTLAASGTSAAGEVFVEEPIEAFIKGNEDRPLVRVTTAAGHRLTVTHMHPFVDGAGNIVEARDIRPGESELTTVDGTQMVAAVEEIPYCGDVWNVQTESLEPAANIFVAQGFLVGSLRYQNEWADDFFRLKVRDHVDLSIFQ